MKVFSLPSMTIVNSIRHRIAVNHCAVDRTGELLAAVGDNCDTVLYDARSNRQIARFQEFTDGAFDVNFSPDSLLMSAVSQDGTVCVWDLRMRQTLWKTRSLQNQTKGAARCLKFAPRCGVDLLMWTEHCNLVHITDMRTFAQQTIRVAPTNSDCNISGCAFSNEADRIFIGTGEYIVEYGIDLYSRRTIACGELM